MARASSAPDSATNRMVETPGGRLHVIDHRANAHLADGVQRALGRQPRDFSDYAQQTAASGVWGRWA